MIWGEYICGNVGKIFHLLVIALMHWAFESNANEAIGKGLMLFTIINE